MTTKQPTNYSARDFMNEVKNCEAISDNARAFAEYSLYKLDARNQARRENLTDEQIANNELKVKMLATFADHPEQNAKAVATAFGISTQKASALLRQLETDGKLTATYAKEGKTYRLAEVAEVAAVAEAPAEAPAEVAEA